MEKISVSWHSCKKISHNFEFYPIIQHNLILSASQMQKLNFIPLSHPKFNFILLSGKSDVGQHQVKKAYQHTPIQCYFIAISIIFLLCYSHKVHVFISLGFSQHIHYTKIFNNVFFSESVSEVNIHVNKTCKTCFT